jgi:hypothetical protein
VSGRFQPSEGADSARPYRVSVVSQYDPNDQPKWIRIPHAYGPADVRNQVDDFDHTLLILAIEEAAA